MFFFQETWSSLTVAHIFSAGKHQVRSSIKIAARTIFFVVILDLFAFGETIPPNSSPNLTESDGKSLRGAIDARRKELKDAETSLGLSEEEHRKFQTEIDSIKLNRTELTNALLELTHKIDVTENEINLAEANLKTIQGSEDSIQFTLNSRRKLIEEILSRLQRFHRNIPPVFLASPSDVLRALSTSHLLADLLPQMRIQVEALSGDLNDLARLRTARETERDALVKARQDHQSSREHLAALIQARQAALTETEKAFEAENIRQNDMARKAVSLRELIKNLEANDLSARVAAQKDQDLENEREKADLQGEKGVLVAPFKNPSRLSPAIAFSNAKGLLPLPVSGSELQRFGSDDGFGGTQKGMLISARASAIVTSPCDGRVVFSGSYRTYGELLIINAGEGYYVILAGMDRIEVKPGQYVLSGEPVAFMGDQTSKTKLAVALGSSQPLLYIEFRKDGVAIDPDPWWVKPDIQKVRG